MQVKVGDTVKMRDGRVVLVTDAADSHPDAWRTYSYQDWVESGVATITSEVRPETIFVGSLVDARTRGWSKRGPVTVVSDMSEVAEIL